MVARHRPEADRVLVLGDADQFVEIARDRFMREMQRNLFFQTSRMWLIMPPRMRWRPIIDAVVLDARHAGSDSVADLDEPVMLELGECASHRRAADGEPRRQRVLAPPFGRRDMEPETLGRPSDRSRSRHGVDLAKVAEVAQRAPGRRRPVAKNATGRPRNSRRQRHVARRNISVWRNWEPRMSVVETIAPDRAPRFSPSRSAVRSSGMPTAAPGAWRSGCR